MMTWTVAAPAISAAFLSSLVEAVEALTIVLAVGTVRGWRPAGLGALVGLVLLALIVLALGPLLIVFRYTFSSLRSASCSCCSACAGCAKQSYVPQELFPP